MKLAIRADMNETIATGHVMRCLSVADAVTDAGGEVLFVTADTCALDLLHTRGYEVIVLGTDWRSMEEELPVWEKLVADQSLDGVLVDSYAVTEKYLRDLNRLLPVTYMDDLAAIRIETDAIVNYELYARPEDYETSRTDPLLYLGPSYAPLREQFGKCRPRRVSAAVERILLMSGGTDPEHMLDRLIALLPPQQYAKIHVLCGRNKAYRAQLKKKYADRPELELHGFVNDMRRLYESVDLAITAGGSTVYELAATGTPSITYALADNQLRNVREFDARDLMDYAGDARIPGEVEGKLPELLDKNEHPLLRQRRADEMQYLLDGKGAERFARILLR